MDKAHQTRQTEGLRNKLLGNAHIFQSECVAQVVTNQALKAFNDAGTSVGTSLLARALVARAMLQVAAAWWADVSRLPEAETYAALLDLIVNPPPEIETTIARDPSIVEE